MIWTPNYQIGPWSDDWDPKLMIWTSNYQIRRRSDDLDPHLAILGLDVKKDRLVSKSGRQFRIYISGHRSKVHFLPDHRL